MLSHKVRCLATKSPILSPVAPIMGSLPLSGRVELKRTLCMKQQKRKSNSRYLSCYVDRVRKQFAIKETDADCTDALKEGRFLLYHTGNALMSKENRYEPILLERNQLEEILDESIIHSQSTFLKVAGEELGNLPLFAISLQKELEEAAVHTIEKSHNGKFTNLRLAMLFGGDYCHMLSSGYSSLKWLHNTKFCSKCGSPAKKNVPGSRITCTNDKCGVIFYPPTSPVGIVLVTSSDHSHVLLVRQPQYPVGMYSCVAGFVDMGETLYDCVKREVAEEAGVEIFPNTIENFKVMASQHWPFPNGSLMTGCLALASGPGAAIPKVDSYGEIEHAKWFEVEEIIEAINRINKNPMLRVSESNSSTKASDIFVPPRGAIAHQLLKLWLKEQHKLSV